MKLIIDEKYDGVMIRSVIKSLGISSTALKRMKQRDGGIAVNGVERTVRYVLSLGDELFLDDTDTYEDENPHIVPTELPLDIIYEDDDIFVLNKPPYMPTHPSLGHYDDTLANALAHLYKMRGVPFVFRAVNRLDGDTSGVVLTAKRMTSARIMADAIANGEVEKRYIAVLDGEMNVTLHEWTEIKNYIRRAGESIIKREVTDEMGGGDLAVTRYKCIYSGNGISVVIAEPVTGRTHQLRVHFSNLGYPIAGDDFYGGSLSRINRQALHAYSLKFRRPSDRELVTARAPIPEDIRSITENLIGDLNVYEGDLQ